MRKVSIYTWNISLLSTILEFTWLFIVIFFEEKASPPHPKRKFASPPPPPLPPQIEKVPKKFDIFPAPSYKIRKNNLAPTKNYLWIGGGKGRVWYVMLRFMLYLSIFYLFILYLSIIIYFLYREFSSSTWKKQAPSGPNGSGFSNAENISTFLRWRKNFVSI